jgi:hypothetical protein
VSRNRPAGFDSRSCFSVDIDRPRAWVGSPSTPPEASTAAYVPSPACLRSSDATASDIQECKQRWCHRISD